jgi:hypothetical protein
MFFKKFSNGLKQPNGFEAKPLLAEVLSSVGQNNLTDN